jgi:hypothetical protein
MGLLDEAIREHLELKRRSGADPAEVARKENEALTPVFPPEERSGLAEVETGADGAASVNEAGSADERARAAVAASAAPMADADGAHRGQETAELDMQAVLDADSKPDEPPQPAPASAAPPVRAVSAPAELDKIEWELAPNVLPVPEEIPGQERLSFE